MGDVPDNTTHADLATTIAWLARFKEAQRARLSEFDEALRRTDRLIALIDGTAEEADALDDVRLLLARGYLNFSLPPDDADVDESAVQETGQGLAYAMLWRVAVAPKWHAGYFTALKQISSTDVATLVSSVHAVKRRNYEQSLSIQLARDLAEEKYAAGILNLLEDLYDPARGRPALITLSTIRDGPASVQTQPKSLDVLIKVLIFIGGAATSGPIGNFAYDVLKQAWASAPSPDNTGGQPKQPAPASTPLFIDLPALNFRMELVRVPAGEFLMGSDKAKDKDAYDDELPQHRVYLDEYLIGKYPVTVVQWAVFAQAASYRTTAEQRGDEWTWLHPQGKGSDVRGKLDHPVRQVSWNDATAFCTWLSETSSRQVALPTEAQWEKAARWDAQKREARIWPWGNTFDKNKVNTYESSVGDTTPVGLYSPKGGDSPYGCADMAGNVWNWCSDWYGADEYKRRANQLTKNPEGPTSGDYRVLLGGSWNVDHEDARAASRNWSQPVLRSNLIGFRVVRPL